MVTQSKEPLKLAQASGFGDIAGFPSHDSFYMPGGTDALGQASGVIPSKLLVPKDYHKVISMCYDFYQRGGIVGTVVNRLTEMAMTQITNGQRKTTDEANLYFDAVLHRQPSRLNRFIHTAALEYFLSGLVLPRVEWEKVKGEELSPYLKAKKTYIVPVVDLYPPTFTKVEWPGWGRKDYYLTLPEKDIRLIRNGPKSANMQTRYNMWKNDYPQVFEIVRSGEKEIKLDVDAILRKETSITQYPTPFLFNILEALTFKQQLRRMDFSVASRIISAILLITEGDENFPITEETRGNLDILKQQIAYYSRNPEMTQRLFPLFSNHTTKLTWIQPDVEALLDQGKYEQINSEISEGLGFATILITGESRNAQASEVSTWAIQPMMEELREMMLEWLTPVYEQAADLNGFRQTPIPTFTPIRLQDFIKTAAVFAEAFKEGNISRTTRDQMMGVSFESELELMKDEFEKMKEVKALKEFPEMPYDINDPRKEPSPVGGGLGRPSGAPKGGRPVGSKNVPVNNRNSGVKPKGQKPTARVKQSKAEAFVEVTAENAMEPEDFFELLDQTATDAGWSIGINDLI